MIFILFTSQACILFSYHAYPPTAYTPTRLLSHLYGVEMREPLGNTDTVLHPRQAHGVNEFISCQSVLE